jgi:hypothetical protein
MVLFTTTLGVRSIYRLHGGVLWSGEFQGLITHELVPATSDQRPRPHEPRRKIEAQTIFNFGAHIASMLLEEVLPEAAPLDGGWPYQREVFPHTLALTFPSRPASLGA